MRYPIKEVFSVCCVNHVGSLGTGLVLGSGDGSMAANPGSSGLGLSGNVFDSRGNNGMYSSRRSRSLDRGGGMGGLLDERGGGGMESRMSGGGNIYSSSGGGGGRVLFDRAMDYDHGRAGGADYDRGDRGNTDSYGRSDTSTVFVKNVRLLTLHLLYCVPTDVSAPFESFSLDFCQCR